MLATTLSRSLTPRQQAFGFSLEEEDDHLLILKLKDEVKGRWYISRANPTMIAVQEHADRVMEEEMGWIEFARMNG